MDSWLHRARPGLATLAGLLSACACMLHPPGAAAARSVSGTLAGSSTWTPTTTMLGCTSDPASSFDVAGAYQSTGLGSGTYSGTIVRTSVGVCPSIFTPNGPFGPGPDFSVGGTLTFSGSRGILVADLGPTSTAHAAETPHSSGYSFALSLIVNGGTRGFTRTLGVLELTYGTDIDFTSACPCLPRDVGTLTGSLLVGNTIRRSTT